MNYKNQIIPLVTCIIPCYKKFDYLYQAIDSVLIQNYGRIELLVSDDGSPNFPKQEIVEYINKNKKENIERVLVHHNEQNIGTVRNMNGMISIAKGDYFINLAGDDVFFDKNVFQKVIERFIKTKVDFLSCSRLMCTDNLDPIKVLPTDTDKQTLDKLDTAEKQFHSFVVNKNCNISGSAMYYSRKNIERMGMFDERYRLWEDEPRITEYARLGNMIPTAFDIVSIKYRIGGVSDNHTKDVKLARCFENDVMTFTKNVIIPDKTNPYKKRRREFIFWYSLNQSKCKKDKIICILKYPIRSFRILKIKISRKIREV